MIDPNAVTSVEELRALVGQPRLAQLTKCLPRLDAHARRWIAASPFLVLASAGSDGRMDVSPKGDPPGFVSVLDDNTLVVPDRPGNRRVDTFVNVIENPTLAMVFLVPGRDETLRVGGRGTVTRDPALLESLAERGRVPALALRVTVDEVMFHCGKSMIRSGMWHPDRWPSTTGLASYAECLADQATADETVGEMEERFASWHAGNELY